jgi:hypothetical protein
VPDSHFCCNSANPKVLRNYVLRHILFRNNCTHILIKFNQPGTIIAKLMVIRPSVYARKPKLKCKLMEYLITNIKQIANKTIMKRYETPQTN